MHHKMLFLLKKFICLFFLVMVFNAAAAQDYIGLSKKEVLLIKGDSYIENTDTKLIYKFPKENLLGSSVDVGEEVFAFANGSCYYYALSKRNFKEDDLLKLIKYNNAHYKRVDIGEKQDYLQWIDNTRRVDFTLNIVRMDEDLFVVYIALQNH